MQEKSSSYECFHAHNDIVTVALFAPSAARRKLPSRATSQNSKVSSSSAPPKSVPALPLIGDHSLCMRGTTDELTLPAVSQDLKVSIAETSVNWLSVACRLC